MELKHAVENSVDWLLEPGEEVADVTIHPDNVGKEVAEDDGSVIVTVGDISVAIYDGIDEHSKEDIERYVRCVEAGVKEAKDIY